MPHLDQIHVVGYKSIRDQSIELGTLNVLIGANGAGKSNFVAVFELLRQLVRENLQVHVAQSGGADQVLHYGRKVTELMGLHLIFGQNIYHCELLPTSNGSLIFGKEYIAFHDKDRYPEPYFTSLGNGYQETALHKESRRSQRTVTADHVLSAFSSWQVYHFHDTSSSSKIKQLGDLDDNRSLKADAGNLSAFLYLLKEKHFDVYRNIVDVIRMVAPFFGDFTLDPDRLNPRKIKLEWSEKGSDAYFDAHALSDGTLRFISLVTLLLQPELPSTILLDEPELGLHPYAVVVLADLLRSATERTQIIVSTQSVTLVNQLSPEDVIVVDRVGGESIFRHLSQDEISSWLDDYALGDLWEKNVIGGRPGS
jgi:predicted ATPase